MKKVTFDSAVEEYVKICDAAYEVTRDPEDFGRIVERVKIRVLSDKGLIFIIILQISMFISVFSVFVHENVR